MLKFGATYMFYFLGIVPVLFLLYFLFMAQKRKQTKAIVDKELFPKVVPNWSRSKILLRYILWSLVASSLVITLAQPKFGLRLKKATVASADFVIALDISNSMLAEDLRPNRLARAKQAISGLLDKLKGDRVGLVIFAGAADVQSSVTNDYATIKMLLPSFSTNTISAQGTALASAIQLSMDALPKERKGAAAIVLLTDGEDHEGAAVEAATKARQNNIIVHTIGVGSETGAPIPIYKNNVVADYFKDRNGEVVISKLNEASLQEIAKAGGGIYLRGSNPATALETVYKEIQKMEKQVSESNNFEGLDDKFQYPLFFAFLLLIVELLISDKANKLLKKIDIY